MGHSVLNSTHGSIETDDTDVECTAASVDVVRESIHRSMGFRTDLFLRRIRRAFTRAINGEIQHLAYNFQHVEAVGWPIVYQVELTNHCPMTCQMCPRTHSMRRPLGFMEVTLFRRIIDQAARSTSRIFLHHFGESLLHPALGDCIRYASKHGIKSYLSANPVLLNEQRIRALVDNGLNEIVLSLDGVTTDTSYMVRGAAAKDVNRAEARINRLIEYRRETGSTSPKIIMQIVRQKQNVHEVKGWLDKWKNVSGVDRVKVKSYVAWTGSEECINKLRLDPEPDTSMIVCDKPWTSMTILWDGRVVPCCFDYDGLLTLGDAKQQTLYNIWHGDRTRQLRISHKQGDFSNALLCARCKDKEGYPVRKWYYPLNRLAEQQDLLGAEWREMK